LNLGVDVESGEPVFVQLQRNQNGLMIEAIERASHRLSPVSA